MALFDFLVNKKPLRRQRDKAIEFAEERYDPSTLDPLEGFYRELSREGISQESENISRTTTLSSLFNDAGNQGVYAQNPASGLASAERQNMARGQALSNFETQLQKMDIEQMMRGERGVAQTQSQQAQIQSQQDSAIKEAELQYQAEVERRGQKIGSTVFGVAGALATMPIDGGASLAQQGLSFLTGGQESGRITVEDLVSSAKGGVQAPEQYNPEIPEIEMEQFDFGDPITTGGQTTAQGDYDFSGGAVNTPSEYMSDDEVASILGRLGYNPDGTPNTGSPMQARATRDNSIDPNQALRESMGSMRFPEPAPQGQKIGSLPDYIGASFTGDRDPTLLGERFARQAINMGGILGPVGEFATSVGTRPVREYLNLRNLFQRAVANR